MASKWQKLSLPNINRMVRLDVLKNPRYRQCGDCCFYAVSSLLRMCSAISVFCSVFAVRRLPANEQNIDELYE